MCVNYSYNINLYAKQMLLKQPGMERTTYLLDSGNY